MLFTELLAKKRDGKALSKYEINSLVSLVAQGLVCNARIGALSMAIYIRGLNDEETVHLASAFVKSGDTLTWPQSMDNLLVDKHSTGGVGDKISIVLVPVLAACGLKVPMITGRSLGYTGGTLDKLESIPGFESLLSTDKLSKCIESVGCFMAGATSTICPVEKIFYSIRDITDTVNNINMIVASIISKKVASGIKKLVIDVKVGRGGFCKDLQTGRILAEKLISVSKKLGVKTRIIISRMDAPLGSAVGNSLEIIESIECLNGKGRRDVMELVYTLGSNLLLMSGLVKSEEEAKLKISEMLSNGLAIDYFRKMIIFQGVSKEQATKLCEDPKSVLPKSKYFTNFLIQTSGFVAEIYSSKIARVCWELGAGRIMSTDERIDHSVGAVLKKFVGDEVKEGQVWLQLHHTLPHLETSNEKFLNDAIIIKKTEVIPPDIVYEIL